MLGQLAADVADVAQVKPVALWDDRTQWAPGPGRAELNNDQLLAELVPLQQGQATA